MLQIHLGHKCAHLTNIESAAAFLLHRTLAGADGQKAQTPLVFALCHPTKVKLCVAKGQKRKAVEENEFLFVNFVFCHCKASN